jgi:hypothetical protein
MIDSMSLASDFTSMSFEGLKQINWITFLYKKVDLFLIDNEDLKFIDVFKLVGLSHLYKTNPLKSKLQAL